MKISRENTIWQMGKTFWRYCYAISHSVPLYTLHIQRTPIQPYLLYNYIWQHGIPFFSLQ